MLSTIFFVGRISRPCLDKLGKNITHVGDIPPLWHGLFVLYKINIAIATTNKGVKWSAFVKTTANMESYGVSFSSHRKTLWRQLQNYELDHQVVTLLWVFSRIFNVGNPQDCQSQDCISINNNITRSIVSKYWVGIFISQSHIFQFSRTGVS